MSVSWVLSTHAGTPFNLSTENCYIATVLIHTSQEGLVDCIQCGLVDFPIPSCQLQVTACLDGSGNGLWPGAGVFVCCPDVLDGTRITDHIPLETPLIASDVSQQ